MSKRVNIAERLQAVAEPRLEPKVSVESLPESHEQRSPSRRGKKMMAGYFEKDVHLQMKVLSAETDKSIQLLLNEALNLLFDMYDKPQITGRKDS